MNKAVCLAFWGEGRWPEGAPGLPVIGLFDISTWKRPRHLKLNKSQMISPSINSTGAILMLSLSLPLPLFYLPCPNPINSQVLLTTLLAKYIDFTPLVLYPHSHLSYLCLPPGLLTGLLSLVIPSSSPFSWKSSIERKELLGGYCRAASGASPLTLHGLPSNPAHWRLSCCLPVNPKCIPLTLKVALL